MQQIIFMFHILISIALVVLVLLQQGKGAEMGAAFGSGASQTLFGSQGSGSFLLKVTAILAGLFFVTSLVLGHITAQQVKQDPLQGFTKAIKTMQKTAPVSPASTIPNNSGVPIPAGMQESPAAPVNTPHNNM